MRSQGVASQPANPQQAKPAQVQKKGAQKGANMKGANIKKQICLDYVQGKCNSNRWHCKYAHPEDVDLSLFQPVAGQRKNCHIWVLTGYCKFGARCRDAHPDLDAERTPKITPPETKLKIKKDQRPPPLRAHQGGYNTPRTPLTPMTPLTPLTPGSGLCWGQMSGCVEVCTDRYLMRVNGILNRLTVAKFDPLFRDLLKLMDVDPVITTSKVVSLVVDKAITETKEMAFLYVEFCRRLFETDKHFARNASYMFELIHAFLLASLSQPAEDEEAQTVTRTKQIGALNVMAELYNKGMIDTQQISSVITWLVHNTKQAEDKALAALSVELLCSVLTSADQQLQRQCPTEHAEYLLGLTSVVQDHSNRLQVLASNVCGLPPVDTSLVAQLAAVHVHCPYA